MTDIFIARKHVSLQAKVIMFGAVIRKVLGNEKANIANHLISKERFIPAVQHSRHFIVEFLGVYFIMKNFKLLKANMQIPPR